MTELEKNNNKKLGLVKKMVVIFQNIICMKNQLILIK